MPYAANDKISTAPLDGGVEITTEQYQDALAGLQQGMRVSIDGGFRMLPPEQPDPDQPQPEPTIPDVKAQRVDAINAAFEAAASALTAGYPEAERLTWMVQQQEALAWQADQAAPTPWLDGLASQRGITPDEMRQLTLNQVQLFMAASQMLVGKRQRLRDAVYAVPDDAPDALDQIAAITWS